MFLLTCDDLAEDLLLRLARVSEYLLEHSEEAKLPIDTYEALESPESTSCSGIAPESLLEVSEDHRLVILARESIDLCPMISYLREDVEYDERLVTEGLLSLPMSTEESRETPPKYLLEDTMEERLKEGYDETSSLNSSRSGEGVGDGETESGGSGGSGSSSSSGIGGSVVAAASGSGRDAFWT